MSVDCVSLVKAYKPVCRRLWQFAIHAVLQDLGEHQLRRLTGDTLLKWRNQRQRYVELWTHHLNSLKGSSDQVCNVCMPQVAGAFNCCPCIILPHCHVLTHEV